MTIGNIICELRKDRSISQQKLADSIGVNQATIAKIEINRNEATAETIRKLATYFDVSADYLLGLEDDFGAKNTATPLTTASKQPATNISFTREERQLIEDFRQLNYYKQELIKNNIKAMLPAEAESNQKKKEN